MTFWSSGSRSLNESSRQIAQHQGEWSDDQRLLDSAHYSLSEIDYLVRHECVEHLIDVILRRTTLSITGSLTGQDLQQIAGVAAGALDWSAERTRNEIEAVIQQLSDKHRMHLSIRCTAHGLLNIASMDGIWHPMH